MHLKTLAMIATLSVSTLAPAQAYHVAAVVKLGVSGGYDYMNFDPGARKLYIAQGTQVVVFDPAAGKVSGTIAGLVHVHGIVLDPDGVTGYISDGGAGVIQLFNRSTLAKGPTIPVGVNPDGMVLDPSSGHLFVFNGKSKTVSVIDRKAHTVLATISLPGKPEFPAADGHGFVYDPLEDTHQVVKIDTAKNTLVATWTIAGCEGPAGMAIDAKSARLFPACDNARLPVIDTANGKVVAMPAIGTGPDAVTFDAERKLIFTSNGDAGTLSILKQTGPDAYAPVATVKTAPKGRTLALDARTGDVYIIAPDPESKDAVKPLLLYKVSR